MGALPLTANALWLASCLPAARRFAAATRAVEATQASVLMATVRANATTEFGRRHGFDAVDSPAAFQARVPLSTYDDYAEDMARIADGVPNVLTAAPVKLLEPTSGSAAAAKLIPYTAPLQQEFQRAIAPWVAATLGRRPALLRGTAYWSVSPLVQRAAHTAGGIPIGFDEDSAYLGGRGQRLVDAVMAVPPLVKQIRDMESFRYVTLLFLVRSAPLTLVSVWNPTFLTLLVEPLTGWLPRIIDDIAAGTLTPPNPLPPDVDAAFRTYLRPDPARAQAVRRALDAAVDAPDLHTRLWPRLGLLSCWADANAAPFAAQLAALFPQAALQPKGLIATEGFVSLPLPGRDGAAPALCSHFLEFLPVDAPADPPRLAHTLDHGARYAVVITTGGGLYRYRLGDVVEVVGKAGTLPFLRFVGRADAVVDWFGEKLHEAEARRSLATAWERTGGVAAFSLLACAPELTPPRYVLYVESAASDDTLRAAAAVVEDALCANFHYAYCRKLGQLGAVTVFRIAGNGARAYVDGCVARGQRAGDVKPALLSRHGDWAAHFAGAWLDKPD